MATPAFATAPVLSTPDTHIFEDPTPAVETSSLPRLSDEQLALTYEIERTVREIREGRWRRIALQFPDHMLVDAPRVYEGLNQGLQTARKAQNERSQEAESGTAESGTAEELAATLEETSIGHEDEAEERLFILADTSYGACCVDEVAAEHVDADVVVHYGRSCLSPPSRLPVVYVFTTQPLELDPVVDSFTQTYTDKAQKVILMADIPYSHHVPRLHMRLQQAGYTNLHPTEIVHSPSSLLPNRTIPPDAANAKDALRDHHLFHISSPPKSLLLTLSSRVASIHIHPTTPSSLSTSISTSISTAQTLRRRYALLTSLSTTPIFGILINTLSVKNYMHILAHVQSQIAAAGKKSYTFVVGKVNAAKVANFGEVGGWVVIGCWESSLIESSDFWRPIVTPFELDLALQSDSERVWTGEWTGDFMAVLGKAVETETETQTQTNGASEILPEKADDAENDDTAGDGDYDSESESLPPEFDLRTGRYVSHSRPMRSSGTATAPKPSSKKMQGATAATSTALTTRANGDLAHVAGVVSPGAEFLRSNRTWQGLGSDYSAQREAESGSGSANAARIEEGRSGIARGYVVGSGTDKH
ncbi:putative diphthamide synthesis protein-domain-containing protein [Massariosphaeria phaeospora]|uniref:2-(3-amino-3-carboxypropyl)histidine synthase subunit 2 n=1 Tax=Massariosphaeria phaeospora TaxID=100035 RepID=A0A7C8IA44_9PLEO|nr:putative diphthamide synthesis protein-domain-containing protein [Massariosphaeria phaeospora]